MVKKAPGIGQITAMVLFTLSVFGLLLFLWIAFGGTTPLKPQGYRFKAAFPEAALLVTRPVPWRHPMGTVKPSSWRRAYAACGHDETTQFRPHRATPRILRPRSLLV